jgi:hypothetical protein
MYHDTALAGDCISFCNRCIRRKLSECCDLPSAEGFVDSSAGLGMPFMQNPNTFLRQYPGSVMAAAGGKVSQMQSENFAAIFYYRTADSFDFRNCLCDLLYDAIEEGDRRLF